MEGQVAIITGGAQGIGKEHASLLITRKVNVVVVDLNIEKGQATLEELKKQHPGSDVSFLACDVTNNVQFEDVFKKTFEKFGRIDIVINNAGLLDESNAALMLAINVNALIQGTTLGIKYMSKTEGGQGGSIINMGSIAGLIPSPPGPVYSATKFAVVGYTRAIGATSLSVHGIRINCICPIAANTDLMQLTEKKIYGPKGTLEMLNQRFSTVKFLEPKTVAECLIPLLDDATLSGAALLCSESRPQSLVKLPQTLDDIHRLCVE